MRQRPPRARLRTKGDLAAWEEPLFEAVKAQFAKAVKLRRKLHQRPELAFEEHQTAATIAAELKRIGCRVTTGVNRTGVLGILEGRENGAVAAVRSDMDALPVTEQTGLSFASKNPGVMHACGHDSHMAMVVSTAAVMAKLRSHWPGTIKFIFQPSEEVVPGGARGMIHAGVLERPKVDMIFGVHVDPWIPVGRAGIKDGVMMAQTDDFALTVVGKSGHGARPHLGVDAIYIAAQIVTAVQSIVSRNTDPLNPAVLSIGKIEGGTATNIVAGRVRLEGTVRAASEKDTQNIRRRLKSIASGVARGLGGKIELDYKIGYPPLYNAKTTNDLYRESLRRAYGPKAVVEIAEPLMGGEDFAMYLLKTPGAMMRLGIRNPKLGATYAWHHPQFTIDEDALAVGIRTICGALLLHQNRRA
jgi:amidohydrolase